MGESTNVICAWCTTAVSVVGKGERAATGICVDCAMAFIKKLPREYLEMIAEPDGAVTLFSGHRLDVATGAAR